MVQFREIPKEHWGPLDYQPLVAFVRQNATHGTIREQFANFRTQKGILPEDDELCKQTIEHAMDVFYLARNETYLRPSRSLDKHPFVKYVRGRAKDSTLRQHFYTFEKMRVKLPEDDNMARAVINRAIEVHFEEKAKK